MWSLFWQGTAHRNLKHTRVNNVVARSGHLERGELGRTHLDGASTCSHDRLSRLVIVYMNTAHKDSSTIRYITNLVHYREEEARAIRAMSPLALRTSQPLSSQNFLSSVDVKKLTMETQKKPLSSDRRWLSLDNSSSVKLPLSDSLFHPLVFQYLKIL